MVEGLLLRGNLQKGVSGLVDVRDPLRDADPKRNLKWTISNESVTWIDKSALLYFHG